MQHQTDDSTRAQLSIMSVTQTQPYPKAIVDAASMNHPTLEEDADARGLRCFLVEDSPVIRQNLIATLEEMLPVTVVGTAEDEASALRWLRESQSDCDLMIIDIFLRSGSGLEVLRAAKSSARNTRLIVLTNFATPDMRKRCLDLGADRVFDKSAELEELLLYCESMVH